MVLYKVYDKKGIERELTLDEIVYSAYKNAIEVSDEIKQKISHYEKRIPLYDILTKKVYLVYDKNVYERVVRNHYRLLDDVEDPNYKLYETIMGNYDLNKLRNIYYKLFYLSQPNVMTSCPRPSFSPIMHHITPYYSENELKHLGLNLKLITLKSANNFDYKKVCQIVRENDIDYSILEEHQNFIFSKKVIGLVKYYSLHGSFYMNNYLRKKTKKNVVIEKQIQDLTKIITSAPPLKKDFSLFRFIRDDSYLSHLEIGSIYTDNSFMSCTRNPFYYETSGSHVFGFVLLKININSQTKVLFMESYSNFPQEQEVLLPPNSKLKLENVNDSFEYYFYDKEFHKKTTRKYEFTYISSSPIEFSKKKTTETKMIDIFNDDFSFLNYSSQEELLDEFIKFCADDNYQFKFKIDKEYVMQIESYDATDLYGKFFYYKVKNGIMFYIVGDKGNIVLLLEIGTEIHVNYYFKYSVSEKLNPVFVNWIAMLAYRLGINKVMIHPDYYSSENNSSVNKFYQQITYQSNIHDYLKKKTKYFAEEEEIEPHINYLKLDSLHHIKPEELLNEDDHDELYSLYLSLTEKIKSVADLYLYLVDYQPFYLTFFLEKMERISSDIDNPFLDPYYQLNVGHYLYNNKMITNLPVYQETESEEEILLKKNSRDNLLGKINIPRIYSRQRLLFIKE